MKASDFYKKYLKVEDIPPEGICCKVVRVYQELVYDRQAGREVEKNHIDLEQYPGLPWIPNNTHGNVLWDLLGLDMAQWVNRQVFLIPGKTFTGTPTIVVTECHPQAKPPEAPPDDLEQSAPEPEEVEEVAY